MLKIVLIFKKEGVVEIRRKGYRGISAGKLGK